MIRTRRVLAAGLLIGSAIGAAHAAVIIEPFTANYYTVLSDPDFNQGKLSSLTVESTLGPNGLPLLQGSSVPVNDLTADKEITWWSPSLNSNVLASNAAPGSIINIPLDSWMYAPAPGTSGSSPVPGLGFLTAHFTGTVRSTDPLQPIYLRLSADDDAFAYIDGVLFSQIGGVHPFSKSDTVSFTLAPGPHTMDVFYADREKTTARLAIALQDSPVYDVPEPSALALVALALAGLGIFRWRERA